MIKVAIIDDNEELLEELEESLALFDFDIYTFSEGSNTIDKLKMIKPDVLLLDLKLKNVNGLDIAADIKKNKQFASLPIIAITGYYAGDNADKISKKKVIDMLLTKPLNIEEIVRKINYVTHNA